MTRLDPNRDYALEQLRRRKEANVQRLQPRRRDVPAEILQQLRSDARLAALKLAPLRLTRFRSEVEEYEAWVAERLAISNLDHALPAGLDALPDIYAAMPWYLRAFEEPFRPKNYKQLLRHLYACLGWYLDPKQRIEPPAIVTALLYGLVVGPLVVALLIFVFDVYWWLARIFAVITPLVAFLLYMPTSGVAAKRGYIESSVNTIELYHYLSQEYGELESRV